MHFWIDKRSQACGFGRARAGFGYDFYHPPRRNKSMLTPVHRFPNVDCRNVNRPNVHRPNVHRSNHHQEHHQHHTSRAHHEIQTHAEVNTQHSYGEPADYSVIQQYQSHLPIELEQGTLGLNAIRPSNEILTDDRATLSVNVADAVNSTDSQILPSHLKCGMWASLALATVFLAAFQGSGLEILIFCAFSATFFVAACTVSLCRRPNNNSFNLNIPAPQLSAVTTNVNDIEIAHLDQHEPHVPNVIDPIAPPPPYHIAILNDNPKIDDSPPPSYDKLII
ncbi:uncharacterized protein LOC129574947 isoform X2 [Sitodiplosis mosellana]|uniref:uncharacterized protein LOC129574947 isoform X2 n=1 Tax=Sitodiplosis mosellana TaxID=263140 RepID=UPI002444B17B|nr:uncharacterized protein LOC129574947 isoform X2 [Sitodiplosis mosellana]